jgi:hypothetical protein
VRRELPEEDVEEPLTVKQEEERDHEDGGQLEQRGEHAHGDALERSHSLPEAFG